MTEQPGQYNVEAPAIAASVAQLRTKCHKLIAKRPGATKLLLGILPHLQIYSSYKSGRPWHSQKEATHDPLD